MHRSGLKTNMRKGREHPLLSWARWARWARHRGSAYPPQKAENHRRKPSWAENHHGPKTIMGRKPSWMDTSHATIRYTIITPYVTYCVRITFANLLMESGLSAEIAFINRNRFILLEP